MCYHSGYEAFTSNHEEYLVDAFGSYYPDFAQGDWFVWKVTHFHVAFSKMVVLLLHLHFLEGGLLLVWFCCALLVFRALLEMVKSCGGESHHFVLAVVMLLCVGETSAGETRPLEKLLVPTMMGFTFFVTALERLLKEKPYQAAVWAGLGGLFHISFAMFGFPLLVVCLLAGPRPQDRLKQVPGCGLIALAVSSPTLVWTALHTAVTPQGLSHVFMIRAPHHMDPTYFPAHYWLLTVVVTVLGGLVPNAREENSRAVTQLKAVLLAVSLLLAGSYLSFVGGGPEALIRAIPWRFSILLLFLSYPLMCAARLERWQFLLGLAVLSSLILVWPVPGLLRGARVLLFLFCVGLSRYRPAWSNWAAVPLCTVTITLLLGLSLNPFSALKLQEEGAALKWIRENTPPGSRFLTAPSETPFRIISHRATYGTFKCFSVLNAELANDWVSRMKKLGGLGPAEEFPYRGHLLFWHLAYRFMNLPADYVDALARDSDCDYILLPLSELVLMEGPRLAQGQLNPSLPQGLSELGWLLVYSDEEYLLFKSSP